MKSDKELEQIIQNNGYSYYLDEDGEIIITEDMSVSEIMRLSNLISTPPVEEELRKYSELYNETLDKLTALGALRKPVEGHCDHEPDGYNCRKCGASISQMVNDRINNPTPPVEVTDEEIEKQADTHIQSIDRSQRAFAFEDFVCGAKWMRDQITK